MYQIYNSLPRLTECKQPPKLKITNANISDLKFTAQDRQLAMFTDK